MKRREIGTVSSVRNGSKSLSTLITDIYDVLEKGNVKIDTKRLAETISAKLESKHKPELRMSNFGTPCDRKLWYTINTPEKGEPLRGNVLIKFLIGDVLEELVLSLAEAAGHTVEHRQATVELAGVQGHIDGVVDGVLVDVKSASTFGFAKFRDHDLKDNDSFGYIDQLGLYANSSEGLVSVKGEAAFIAVDKQHGHLALDKHKRDHTRDWEVEIEAKKEMLAKDRPPVRGFHPEPDGASGNMKLGVACSYCNFRHECYPGLRTFIYSSGPRYLTHVVREPNVPEVKK